LSCVAEKTPETIIKNSAEEFIAEHYWGYTFISKTCTGVYEVVHPKWRVHKVKSYDVFCSIEQLYGKDFVSTLNQKPQSVFLADGSEIRVLKGVKIYQ